MMSRFDLPCLFTRLGVMSRSLGLLYLCLSLLLLATPPVASQGADAGGRVETPSTVRGRTRSKYIRPSLNTKRPSRPTGHRPNASITIWRVSTSPFG